MVAWCIMKSIMATILLLSGSGQFVKHFKPLVASSDDRLKGNEVIIKNDCDTLS